MPGGVDASVNGLGEVGADELDIVVCLGGVHLKLLDGVEEDGGGGLSAEAEDFLGYVRHLLEKVDDVVGDDADTVDVWVGSCQSGMRHDEYLVLIPCTICILPS